jgi:signal transduction histidine kinase
VPIELFRALNALVIAFFFIRALRIFAAEDRRRLEEAIRHERQLQAGAEALNNELRDAAKEMAALYDQLRQRDEVHSFLLKRVVRAQEDERRRVARDLHDGVGQTLSGLATGLAALESRFHGLDEPARKQMENMKAYAMQSVEELHRVITDLRPSLLDELGLVAALRWYARHYAETLPLTVKVDVQGQTRRLSPEIETVLFRIAQESLTNVVRHARANYATIRLTMDEQRVVLEIEDDGIGFDPPATFSAGGDSRPWGLLGMQERADLVGGAVDVQSQAWKGSKVTVTIPLPATGSPTERSDDARADS